MPPVCGDRLSAAVATGHGVWAGGGRPPGGKIIKFYAWEQTFVGRIVAKRDQYLGTLLRRKVANAATTLLAISTPHRGPSGGGGGAEGGCWGFWGWGALR